MIAYNSAIVIENTQEFMLMTFTTGTHAYSGVFFNF